MESVGEYEYSKKDLIGHGAFAIVFSGRKKRRPDEIVAVKCINKKNLSKSQTFPEKEIEILKDLHHENVVALLYFKDTPTSLVLVMEYCNGGDLADYLHSKGTLSEDTIRLFLKQIASAMKVLHNKGIIHRDLKPQNILLSHNLKTKRPRPSPAEIKLKIADFGFARFLEADMMAATLCGSPLYMAPEVIMSQQYDSKADLWSVGTIIFQCLTGSAPFKASNPQELKNFYQRRTTLEPAVPTGTSKELKDLLIRLLKKKQKERIDFDAFFSHPFIGKTLVQPPTSSSAPMPVPCRTHSFSSDSPEHRTISVSPLSGNMPVSSPEDQALHQRKSSHSPSPHRGMVMMKKQLTGSPGSMEKYGTPPSTSSLDNEGLEDDFVLVSSSDLPSDMPLRTMGYQQEKRATTNTGFSPSSSPHGVKFTLGSSPLRLSSSPTHMQRNVSPDPSPSERPTSLPIPATSRRKSMETTSPTRQRTQERRVSPTTGAILQSPKDRTSPGRMSPQGLIQFGRSTSPVGAVGLVSPSSLPALGSPGTGVLHRTGRFPTSPTSPKLNVSLTPPEGANQSPVMIIQAARTSPPSRPVSGGSPTHGGYSPSRRRCKGSHVLAHHPLEVSTPARCPPLGFANPSLPTILGSPTKKIGIMGSPVSPGSRGHSPSQEAVSKSHHIKIVGDGVDIEELRKEDGKGTEFETEYEVPEVRDKNYFDGEELFHNLNFDILDQDSDTEDDGLTSFERLAREMDDVTGDRGIIRKVQKTGTGAVVPRGSNVVVHYNCYLEEIHEPYDSTRLRNKPERFVIGRGEVIPFLDIAVSTMRKGEITRFLVKPQYAYGEMGVPPRIPGNALILAQIELISFSEHVTEEETHTWSYKKKGEATFKTILKEVVAHRQAGNDLYNQGVLHKAKHKYQKAERLLEDARLKDEEEEDEMKRVMLKIYLNLSLCNLKLKESTRALTYSKKALQIDAKNTKGLFRCGQAYYQCSDFSQARKHMLQAQRQCPNDPSISKELAKLELSWKKFKALENNMYTNMFPGWRDVEGSKVTSAEAQKKNQGPCSDEFKRQTRETIENFHDNPDLQVMPFAVDIRTNEEIAFIQSAAIDMGLEVKAFSQTGEQDRYVKIIKPVAAEET